MANNQFLEVIMSDNRVLCIRTNKLPDAWKDRNNVISMPFLKAVWHIVEAGYDFISRDKVEKDQMWKQIIPCAVVHTDNLTAVYQRRGSEKRLHDLWTVCIGGHVEYRDMRDAYNWQGDFFLDRAIKAGLDRELDEEFVHRRPEDSMIFCGIINDDTTQVGRHHLGLLFEIRVSDYREYVPGPELKNFIFSETDKMPERLDSWAFAALEHLKNKKS